MSDWRSCDNCIYTNCAWDLDGVVCDHWEPIRCRCGGALSEIREHNGKKYRHCYACHSEFFEEEEA